MVRRVFFLLGIPFLALGLLWLLGLFIYQPIALIVPAVIAGLVWWKRRRFSVWLYLWAAVLLGVAVYLLIPGPSPEKWQTPWAENPQCSVEGDVLRIRKVRDFH